MAAGNNASGSVSLEKVQDVLRLVGRLPVAWLILVGTAVVLSTVEVTKAADGAIALSYRFTALTAVLVALVWLPSLIRVIALTGGGIKTPAGEATTTGLLDLLKSLDPGTQREAYSSVIGTLDVAETEVRGADLRRLQDIREEFQNQLATLPADSQRARQQLLDYAKEYGLIRQNMPSGSERTQRMSAVVAGVRGLARQAKLESDEIRSKFDKGDDGDRIVALGIVREALDADCLDIVLKGIGQSKSAFEQYHALRTADDLLPSLNAEQERRLVDLLHEQRSGRKGAYITRNTDRWPISSRILAAASGGAATRPRAR